MIGKVAVKTVEQESCSHNTGVDVYCTHNYLEDTGRHCAEIRIVCSACLTPFRFLGLPYGLDLTGAACSPDGTEGRFSIAPGKDPIIAGGIQGFGLKMFKRDDTQ